VATVRKLPLVVRFGPFEADLHSGELLRSGAKVKLQDQPFQVLAALLERAGQVVTRDELRQMVWQADTFVDFERGLNKAINRLRESLGDSAEKPMFIETLPRRGYRFIAPVERNIRSLAVLPLENLSGDPNLEHWADGITDEMITHVAKIVDLRVISRTSIMRFKHTQKSTAEIARELSVDALLQGSVVVSDQRVRIRAQLVDPFSEQHLWAETYDRELGDVITLQAQIALAIARHIRARLTPEEHARSEPRRPVNPQAYEAYLKGRFFWSNRTTGGLEKAVEYFSRAVSIDVDYAPAYSGLADTYIIMSLFGSQSPHDLFPKAKKFAEKALALDETLAEAHKSLGAVRDLYEWDWTRAEQAFTRALELDTNCAIAHQWYAALLSNVRRYDEAVVQALQARDLDPLSLVINAFVGFMYMRAGQHDYAIEECSKAVELDPNNPFGHWILARSFDAADKTAEALEEAKQAAMLSGNHPMYAAQVGYERARTGDRAGALSALGELAERRDSVYVSPIDFALVYSGLGETDPAFEYLDAAYRDRTPRLPGHLWEKPFDRLRSDARFQDLVRRIGLASTSD
jgi:TolB-like protein/Tfp pilus assembly protein PilF